MKKHTRIFLLVFLNFWPQLGSSIAEAQLVDFHTSTDEDLIGKAISSDIDHLSSSNNHTTAIKFAYPISNQNAAYILQKTTDVAHRSKGYWIDVTEEELSKGISLKLSAPDASILISSRSASPKRQVNPAKLELTTPMGVSYINGRGLQIQANSSELQAIGMGAISAFQIRQDIPTGQIILRDSEANSSSQESYRIQVFEKRSSVEMHLSLNRRQFLPGAILNAKVSVKNGRKVEPFRTFRAALVSPDGKVRPLSFISDLNGIQSLKLPIGEPDVVIPGKLWELHVHGSSSSAQRSLRFPIGLYPQTAIAEPIGMLKDNIGNISATFRLRVGASGRYQLSGILYGISKNNQEIPIALAHSAAWLTIAGGELALEYDHQIISSSGVQGPYTLKKVELFDQSRLALLSRQENVMTLN